MNRHTSRGFLVVAGDGGGQRSWVVGAVDAGDPDTARELALRSFSDRIRGGYVFVRPLPRLHTVDSVNSAVDLADRLREELEEAEAALDAML